MYVVKYRVTFLLSVQVTAQQEHELQAKYFAPPEVQRMNRLIVCYELNRLQI